MATETSGIQRFLTYNGNQVGGGLQYNYAGRMNILLDLGYSKKVEDAITTPTSPRYLGTTKDGLWSGKLMAYIPDAKKNTHFVEAMVSSIDFMVFGKRMEKKENIKCITKVSALPTKLKR